MATLTLIGVCVFLIAFLLIVFDVFNIAAIALLGGFCFIFLNILNGKSIYDSVDWNVIFLLIGMMLIVTCLKRTGIFQYIAIKLVKLSKGNSLWILVNLTLITGVFSAFFDNVTTILLIIPITLLICNELAIPALPFVLSEIFSSNVGGAATLIGDPPNLLIGSAAKLSFNDFLIYLGPPVVVTLILFCLLSIFLWRKQLKVSESRRLRLLKFNEHSFLENKKDLILSSFITACVFIGFVLHHLLELDAGILALAGGAVLLLQFKGEKAANIFAEIEWETIFFFIGLFIMVHGLEQLGILKLVGNQFASAVHGRKDIVSVVLFVFSSIASGIINNVPFVATMIPIVETLNADLGFKGDTLWWAMALGACFGGNLTIVGASANVIGISILSKNKIKVTFIQFFKYSSLFTLLSVVVSLVYITIFLD